MIYKFYKLLLNINFFNNYYKLYDTLLYFLSYGFYYSNLAMLDLWRVCVLYIYLCSCSLDIYAAEPWYLEHCDVRLPWLVTACYRNIKEQIKLHSKLYLSHHLVLHQLLQVPAPNIDQFVIFLAFNVVRSNSNNTPPPKKKKKKCYILFEWTLIVIVILTCKNWD